MHNTIKFTFIMDVGDEHYVYVSSLMIDKVRAFDDDLVEHALAIATWPDDGYLFVVNEKSYFYMLCDELESREVIHDDHIMDYADEAFAEWEAEKGSSAVD